VSTHPSQPLRPATVWIRRVSSPPKVVSNRGSRSTNPIAAHTRFVITDMVRAKLRAIHLRCSTSPPLLLPARYPATVTKSHTAASRRSLARSTRPNGPTAPIVIPSMPAGRTPPKT
jgi:hypothetical protein